MTKICCISILLIAIVSCLHTPLLEMRGTLTQQDLSRSRDPYIEILHCKNRSMLNTLICPNTHQKMFQCVYGDKSVCLTRFCSTGHCAIINIMRYICLTTCDWAVFLMAHTHSPLGPPRHGVGPPAGGGDLIFPQHAHPPPEMMKSCV